MSSRMRVQDPTGIIVAKPITGRLQVFGTGAPSNSVAGYAPGCIYHRINGSSGTALYLNEGTVTSSTWVALGTTTIGTLGVTGVAAGYKLARGTGTLDGSNPTPVTHGLTTIVAAVASLIGTAAPGVGTSLLTCEITGTTFNVYAWKVTGAGDTTLIASTGVETFFWIAVGT